MNRITTLETATPSANARSSSLLLAIATLVLGVSSTQAQIVEKPVYGSIAITNVDIYPVTGEPIQDGVVLISGDKIEFVGKNVKPKPGYTVIDGTGKRVYPGFIDSNTRLGLVEVSSVSLTADFNELGTFKPEMLAFTAINPNGAAIPVTRVEGVTSVVSTPQGGRIAGKSALIDLWGYSPDSMAVHPEAGLVLNWPSVMASGWGGDEGAERRRRQYERQVAELDDFLSKARFYDAMASTYEAAPAGKSQFDRDPVLEAMRPVLNGEVPVVVSVGREVDILNAIRWTRTQSGLRFVFSGVQEGWRVADSLAASKIPVIVSTLYTPVRPYDNYQRPYQNPGLLAQAGVTVLMASFNAENTRNVIFNAGYAAAYGMGKEEAIRSLTIHPATVWGVADRLGSIEVGKQANMFLVDGDPLETTSKVSHVIIRGRSVPMTSRHTQLFDQFLDRDSVQPTQK